jgi:hypothetical protein
VINIKDFSLKTTVLLYSGADQNCILKGLIPTKYYEKTSTNLYYTLGNKFQIKYKLPNAHICNQQFCFINSFILVKNLNSDVILGTHFLTQIYPFVVDHEGVHTKVGEIVVTFLFLIRPRTKERNKLKKNTIIRLHNQINLLKEDV